jgi:hypothetical protein
MTVDDYYKIVPTNADEWLEFDWIQCLPSLRKHEGKVLKMATSPSPR